MTPAFAETHTLLFLESIDRPKVILNEKHRKNLLKTISNSLRATSTLNLQIQHTFFSPKKEKIGGTTPPGS